MTISKKSEQSGLELETVVDLARAEGIESGVNDELSTPDAMKLGKAVKGFNPVKSGPVRFWSKGKVKTAFVPEFGPIKIKNHSLVCDSSDEVVGIVRRLNVSGLYEVLDKPFNEDSDSYERFEAMLRDMAFAGVEKIASKGGVKALRALFSSEQLEELGDKAFAPARLVSKALRSKSLVPVGKLRPIF